MRIARKIGSIRANHGKLRLLGGLALAGIGALAGTGFTPGTAVAASTAPAIPCADLAKFTSEGNTTVVSAEVVTGGELAVPGKPKVANLPEFCRVVGVSKPTADSNINFEVWLPTKTWNGRFLSAGEGGFAGAINYSRNGLDGGVDELVRRGYVTATTDTGHGSSDKLWAIGHPERVIDYAYRAKHLVTVAAKGLIGTFYGHAADYSYFSSCSNGGRQALMEAQRYPEDFDGLIAGAPWNFQSHTSAGIVWSAQALAAPGASIPAAKLHSVQAAAIAACGKIDGVADGLIGDPRKCKFDPAALTCLGADSDVCLSKPQVDALKKLYSGPANPRTGESIAPGWEPGGEAGWDLNINLAQGYFGNLVFEDPNWDFKTFDFDKGMAAADAKIGAKANATNPDLSGAKRKGAKIIVYHGWNDQILEPAFSPQYYEQVAQTMGGMDQTRDFFRLFMVPGMNHCRGGIGTDRFDAMSAIVNWVEAGTVPDRIVAARMRDGKVDRTRPLCPHPLAASYSGSGSVDEAANFVCRPAE
jgi:feruloyl esterase